MSAAQELQNSQVILEPASEANVDLLVRWTLDPVAQGPYKQVPEFLPARDVHASDDEPQHQHRWLGFSEPASFSRAFKR